jgi:formate hydrogenlyase subunit 3/multisubunit Na+/H+ antiporter MnhD subunit
MNDPGFLLAAALATPVAASLACLSRPLRERMLAWLWLAPVPALASALDALLEPEPGPVLWLDPDRLQIGLALDRPGAILLAVAALLWSAAGAYAYTYLRDKPNGGRFAVYWLLTLTGSLGVFVAADLASFYLLFALVSLPAWGLVAHDGTPSARRAGVVYLVLALLGEVFLLMGFVLLAAASPGDSLAIGHAVTAFAGSQWRDLTIALLVAGFGLKAGLVPLHVWLPIAHPAAPMPASAVLSGAIVKAGIIGLIRFLPWGFGLADSGQILVAVGLFTAFYAVVIGILQDNPKTVLAYSTASQMGVVCAVLGMGLAAGNPGTILAGTFYAAHHLLAKGALFLAVGVIAATGTRRLRMVLIPAAILGLGLAGLPLTGGALAKLAVKPVLGDGLVGWLGTLSAVGTALLMLHFMRRAAAAAAPDPQAQAAVGIVWPWWVMLTAALALPWALLPVAGLGDWTAALAYSTTWPTLWAGVWPVLVGAALAVALGRWGRHLPKVPEGDLIGAFGGIGGWSRTIGAALERADGLLRQWPIAGLSLLLVTLALGLAMLAGH